MIRQFAEKGMTSVEIAPMVELPGEHVYNAMKQMGFKPLKELAPKKINNREKERNWAKNLLHGKQVPDIKNNSYEGKISVRIDAKTVVFVKPGTNIKAVKKKYEKQLCQYKF